MAFFKFRKGGDEQPTPPTASESVEAMRRRARHRLVGAAVLVAIGVVGFPILFDSQPRPIAVDIPIEIPDKGKVRPLGAPALPAATQASGVVIEEREEPAPAAPAASQAQANLAESKTAALKPEAKPDAKPEPKAEPKVEAKAPSKPEPKPDTKPVEKIITEKASDSHAVSKSADAAKAQALLDGKSAPEAKPADKKTEKKPAADAGRFVVQVGAYNEHSKLQEARGKVEKAGFKTYTQVVGPKDNQRTRIRVGPFASKAEAQKAADKLKKLNLPAAILEL